MSLYAFPRFVQGEFAPMFRLLDEYANFANSKSSGFSQSIRSWQPRFDVKETKEGYELQGEFPGLEQKDINIEFTDANTLSIKGRTERHHEEGNRPGSQVEAASEQPKIAESENGYHKASVEDEDASTMSGGNPEATPVATPAESTVAETEAQEAAQEPKDSSKYWVSERFVGEFFRTFTFPSRVDQENVKASLKEGILSILVPKAQIPANKRINIE